MRAVELPPGPLSDSLFPAMHSLDPVPVKWYNYHCFRGYPFMAYIVFQGILHEQGSVGQFDKGKRHNNRAD